MAEPIDRLEIARRHGVPAAADQLVGETRGELEADAAARSAIASMFGGPRDLSDEPEAPTSLTDYTDDQLEEQHQALEAERVRRREEAEAQEFGAALTESMGPEAKHRRDAAILDAIHGEDK